MPSIFRVDGQLQELTFARVGQQYDVPDYVADADASDAVPDDVTSLPLNVFGCPDLRLFPCHTKAACYLSLIDFYEQRSSLSRAYATRAETTLTKHAAAWGILPEVAKIRNKSAELQRGVLADLPDSDFAMVRQLADGSRDRRYPLRNANEIKAAAAWLVKYAYELPYADRNLIANRICERADETATTLPELHHEQLEMLAGAAIVSREKLSAAITSRARLIASPSSLRDELYKMAAAFTAADDDQLLTQDTVTGLIRNLDDIDRAYNFAPLYGTQLLPPEAAVYNCTYKAAAAALNSTVQLTTGDVYHHNDFAPLSLSDLRDTFGEDIAEQCSDGLFVDIGKLAEVAQTFPRPDAEALVALLEQHGTTPLTKLAADGRRRLTHEDWLSLVS
jgi:hypothetical protein